MELSQAHLSTISVIILGIDRHKELLTGICGDDVSGKEYLNAVMPGIVHNLHETNTTVYLHYSKNEHTYDEHIKYMINDLESAGVNIEQDVKNYKEHADVALFFPSYLHDSILKIINKN